MNKVATKTSSKQRNSVSPARLAAFEILRRVAHGGYASVLLAARAEELEARDRALTHELVMGVLRFQLWLDLSIEYFAGRSITELDLAVRLALRLGLYQLRFLTRIPHSAAVNESVSLVRRGHVRSADGFVNAVLRRATRELEYDPATGIEDPLQRLTVSTSHPRWLIERWVAAFGLPETAALAAANNEPAPLVFRVVRRDAAADILQQLRDAGATLEASQIAEGAWRIQGGGELGLKLAREGKIYFQDEASQLVAQVVAPHQGDTVLDVCAAPGSKASQLASSQAQIIAGDKHLYRLKTVRETFQAHGLANGRCLVLDGESGLPFRDRSFERVLVDAPCSGTGTLRHNPEIRWRISAPDILELSNRQRQILTNASLVVKPGGRLVYSTCSVEPEENEVVVRAFAERSIEFEPITLAVNETLLTPQGAARTWPQRHNTDGFFIMAFTRKR
ncbi:MAG TPA: 16S rRNA (cytosine(967)-C(5))-methyltransferase RsmB [Pyrinomonadaceae bacterium]|nr:16S rRNA (cytosine(967)-C(5))-methyltransferase RsmB [Pyrinomonadaceae bacterium]